MLSQSYSNFLCCQSCYVCYVLKYLAIVVKLTS